MASSDLRVYGVDNNKSGWDILKTLFNVSVKNYICVKFEGEEWLIEIETLGSMVYDLIWNFFVSASLDCDMWFTGAVGLKVIFFIILSKSIIYSSLILQNSHTTNSKSLPFWIHMVTYINGLSMGFKCVTRPNLVANVCSGFEVGSDIIDLTRSKYLFSL